MTKVIKNQTGNDLSLNPNGGDVEIISGNLNLPAFYAVTQSSVVGGTSDGLPTTTGNVKIITSSADIQGILAKTEGTMLVIFNDTGSTVTLRHENGSATATNRIHTTTGSDVVLSTGKSSLLIYNTSRWRMLSAP